MQQNRQIQINRAQNPKKTSILQFSQDNLYSEIRQNQPQPLISTQVHNNPSLENNNSSQSGRSWIKPNLNWGEHNQIQLYYEFLEFIENRYEDVKRKSTSCKYYTKISFQVFIYFLNCFELWFTILYSKHNEMKKSVFLDCYLLSIITCVLLHCATWMYTYKFRQIAKKSLLEEGVNYMFFMFMGALSYFKVAPFLCYFNRNESIKQFSFSEINKYLILNGEDKFRNPSRLFKKRESNGVNIFRDLIFHRVALLSMMITMCLQTFPQIFIQGFYNTQNDKWNDGYNIISFLLLIGNLIYYLSELLFIVYTTTYRQMQTELQFKLQKIKIKFIQETKQLLKSDQLYMGFVEQFYFHIDPIHLVIMKRGDVWSRQQHSQQDIEDFQKFTIMHGTFEKIMNNVKLVTLKNKIMYQQISYKFKTIQILYIDQYDRILHQYLKNCFSVIQVEKISLFCKDQQKLRDLQDIFAFPNLTLELQSIYNTDNLWTLEEINFNAEAQKTQQIQFIENKKMNSGWQVLQMNQRTESNVDPVSIYFRNIINNQSLLKVDQQPSDIIEEARNTIKRITKRSLLMERLGIFDFLIFLYECYDKLTEMDNYQVIISLIWSILNCVLQCITLVYISQETDIFTIVLIILTTVNAVIQIASFTVFQRRALKDLTPSKKLLNIILFSIFNFFKIWDIVLFALYTNLKHLNVLIQRNFSGQGYIKFKSYASKFEGSLPVSVFQYNTVQVDTNNILQIKQQPFYQAVMWRTSVEEAINKIPQFFIYVLALSSDSNEVTFLWVVSFLQQLKEGILAVRDILEVVVKDFFIPALILSTVSVEQFFQSMLYLSSISNQMLLEYPKSFQILSKVKEEYLRDQLTLKINLMNINFSNYEGNKKIKMLAQFRYVLASTQNILEIDQAQKLFHMGPEIHDFIKCLVVSPIYQLKLNFNLLKEGSDQVAYINSLVQLCPKNLKFLQISVETSKQIELNLSIERFTSLKSFSYSYYLMIMQTNGYAQVQPVSYLYINRQFLQLDNYRFEQLYFEITGYLILNDSQEFFQRFTEMKFLKLSLINKNQNTQIFYFNRNLTSNHLEALDITFESIRLEFKNFPFNRLKKLKLVIKNCEFSETGFFKILNNLNYQNTKSVQIEIIDKKELYTTQDITDLVKNLEGKKIDVSIKVEKK